MPFSFNGWEIFFLILLAVLIFGPEKLPEVARKTVRVVHFLRTIANNATTTLKAELGPEYADYSLADFDPRAMVRRELESLGLNDIKQELASVQAEVRGIQHVTGTTLTTGGAAVPAIVSEPASMQETGSDLAFDDEAT